MSARVGLRSLLGVGLVGGVCLLSPRLVSASDFSLTGVLQDPSPSASADFGFSVAIDSGRFLVGARGKTVSSVTDAGAAYLYNAQNGALLQSFFNPTPQLSDRFGWDVALDGDYVVIGSQIAKNSSNVSAGQVYIYSASNGALLHTLDSPNPVANGYFGTSVAISGGTVIVGAWGEANSQGAVYQFDAVSGALTRTLRDPDYPSGSTTRFGYDVAIEGNSVVIGAPFKVGPSPSSVSQSGQAYLFDATTGSRLLTYANPVPQIGAYFGTSVAISGTQVVIGAPNYNDSPSVLDSGAAYLYETSGSTLVRTFTNPDPATEDYFGSAVAISGGSVLVGAYKDDTLASNAGRAYLFDSANAALLQAFVSPTPTPPNEDWFAASVAIDQGSMLIGAYPDDRYALDAGAAYYYVSPTLSASSGSSPVVVPGPTPLVGAFAAFAWSRRVRARVLSA